MFEDGQAIAHQAKEHHFAVVGLAISGLDRLGANRLSGCRWLGRGRGFS